MKVKTNSVNFVFEQPMWLTFSPCELTFKGKNIQRYSLSQQTKCIHTALSFLIRGDFAVSIVRSEFRYHQMDCRWGVQTEFRYICWCMRPSLTASLKDTFTFLALPSLERHRPFSRKLETPLREQASTHCMIIASFFLDPHLWHLPNVSGCCQMSPGVKIPHPVENHWPREIIREH